MKNSLYILARDDSLICRTPDDPQVRRFLISGIKQMPNIPFHHYLWDDPEKSSRDFSEFRRQLLGNHLVSKIVKPTVFLVLPEDFSEVDKRALIEFCMFCGAHTVHVMPECLLLSDAAEYVAITRTCRMTVLCLVRQKDIVQTRYLENREYSEDDMKREIGGLFASGDWGGLPVLLNGEIPDSYRRLGETVPPEAILERFVEVTRGK